MEYRNHTIELDETTLCFKVSGTLFEKPAEFDTGFAAKAAIDTHISAAGTAKRVKVALDVLTANDGLYAKITGINLQTGRALGLKPVYRYDSAETLPAVGWLKALVDERISLNIRRKQITETLSRYRISDMRSAPEAYVDYEAALQKLVDEHAAATARAIKDAPAVEPPPLGA